MRDICRFFRVPDSAHLTWAHEVNHPDALRACCADDSIMMIEGDVLMPNSAQEPMMASHLKVDGRLQPGAMSFKQWLSMANMHLKGVKVDIHSPAALQGVLTVLQEVQPEVPLILHADVFNLLDTNEFDFEPEMFIQESQRHWPGATLSLGWSLRRGQDPDGKLEAMIIEQMTDLLLTKLGGLAYTIEMRGGYTTNWERGAAFILEPIEGVARPEFADNVIDGVALFRSHLFAANE